MPIPNPLRKTPLAKKPIASKPASISERVATKLAPAPKPVLAKKPLDLRTNAKPGYTLELAGGKIKAQVSGSGSHLLRNAAKQIGRVYEDVADPIGLLHKKKSLLKDVTDPVGTALEKVDPRLAEIRKQAGLAGAVGLTAGFVSSAVGLGAGGAAGDVAFNNGGPMDFLDSLSDTLGDIGGIVDKGRGILDSFGGSNGSPDVPPQTVVVQQKLPMGLLIGGGVALLVVVLIATRK